MTVAPARLKSCPFDFKLSHYPKERALTAHSGSTTTALFCDIGGVFLSNAWDRNSRAQAVQTFALERVAFDRLHNTVISAFETGQMSLDEYLDRTVFYKPRAFTKDEFKQFIYAQSRPCEEALELLASLAAKKQYVIGAINNESRDLNRYRIDRFDLYKYFAVFFSSCYLGVRKPDERIYHLALEMTGRFPGESVFIDDREENVRGARGVGMHAVQYKDGAQLRTELQRLGVC
ncbi:MAG: HAD family phosphatase [Acidobacteria bacterium]|nr:HAD family phosphatase [Acidobacteriota bacterium]